jgi:uncharacterized protein YjbI with pentapeptide repeats
LTGTGLDGADLTGACLDYSYLLATDFGDAHLQGATFKGAIWDHNTTWPSSFDPSTAHVGKWRGRSD